MSQLTSVPQSMNNASLKCPAPLSKKNPNYLTGSTRTFQQFAI
jgi:hypothetical protein